MYETDEHPESVVPAALRWAQAVVVAVRHEIDLRTVEAWAQAAGLSRSALATRCHLVRTAPKRSLDLARILRAVHRYKRAAAADPLDLLDVTDERTLAHILERGGLRRVSLGALTLDLALDRQSFVTNIGAKSALARLLSTGSER